MSTFEQWVANLSRKRTEREDRQRKWEEEAPLREAEKLAKEKREAEEKERATTAVAQAMVAFQQALEVAGATVVNKQGALWVRSPDLDAEGSVNVTVHAAGAISVSDDLGDPLNQVYLPPEKVSVPVVLDAMTTVVEASIAHRRKQEQQAKEARGYSFNSY